MGFICTTIADLLFRMGYKRNGVVANKGRRIGAMLPKYANIWINKHKKKVLEMVA